MRPIDADALREVIEDHVTAVSCCPTVDWSKGKTQFKEQCLEDIDNAPTIDILDKWISVKDRLPELNEDVIICYEWTGRFSGHTYREITCTTMKECEMGGNRIIAWMPFPEAPKGDENNA